MILLPGTAGQEYGLRGKHLDINESRRRQYSTNGNMPYSSVLLQCIFVGYFSHGGNTFYQYSTASMQQKIVQISRPLSRRNTVSGAW